MWGMTSPMNPIAPENATITPVIRLVITNTSVRTRLGEIPSEFAVSSPTMSALSGRASANSPIAPETTTAATIGIAGPMAPERLPMSQWRIPWVRLMSSACKTRKLVNEAKI